MCISGHLLVIRPAVHIIMKKGEKAKHRRKEGLKEEERKGKKDGDIPAQQQQYCTEGGFQLNVNTQKNGGTCHVPGREVQTRSSCGRGVAAESHGSQRAQEIWQLLSFCFMLSSLLLSEDINQTDISVEDRKCICG